MTDERKGLPSASSFRRYELCRGSYELEKQAERIGQSAHDTSEWAETGKGIHARLEGKEVSLSESEAQTAQLLKERGDEQIERIFQGQEYQTLREKRLWLSLDGKPALSGRFDVVYYNEETALIQDYKTGFIPPEGEEQNAQMRVLAVLCGLHLTSVKEVIIQLITGPFGIFERRFTIKDLAEAYRDILETLRAINAPSAPLVPGVFQCRHCPAVNICQACRDLLSPPTKFQIAKLPLEPDRSAKLLDEIAVLESVFEEVKKFYYNRLVEDPTAKIDGYELVPNAPRREIGDVEVARHVLSEYLDDGELNTALDLKVGQVEKLFGKKLGLKGKDLREKFNSVMKNVIIEKTPSPSLKRVRGEARVAELIV